MNAIPPEHSLKVVELLRSGMSHRKVAGLVGHSKITIMRIASSNGVGKRQPTPRAMISKQVHRKKEWLYRKGMSQYQRLLRNYSVREQVAILLAVSDRPLTKEEIWLVLRSRFPDLKLYALSRILNYDGDHNLDEDNGLFTYNPNKSCGGWMMSDKELREGSPRLTARAAWFSKRGIKDEWVDSRRKGYEDGLEYLKKLETLRAVEECRMALQMIDAGKELAYALKKFDSAA